MKIIAATLLLAVPAMAARRTRATCDDDRLARVFVEATGKAEPCVWLASRMDEFGDLCQGEFGIACPETCNLCNDNYFCIDTDLRFMYDNQPRGCKWLSLRNSVIDSPGICEQGSDTSIACPETCGFCEVNDTPGYGALEIQNDISTGLPLLAVPAGFRYMSFGWTGQIMDDGNPTPTDHDGKSSFVLFLNAMPHHPTVSSTDKRYGCCSRGK